MNYAMAPVSAHSLAMNATIIGEVIAASVLLVVIAWMAFRGRDLTASGNCRPNPDGRIAKLCAAKLSPVVCCRIMAGTSI